MVKKVGVILSGCGYLDGAEIHESVLTLLHLDGTENRLPEQGAELRNGEKVVGFVGSSARHHELGPIALAMVKRNVPLEATLEVDSMPAAQEVVVDPEVGLHVRPKLR